MCLQYFAAYFPAEGWRVESSPNMLCNWNVNWKGGGATIPMGVQARKVFAIGEQPFSAALEGGYDVVRLRDGSVPSGLIGLEFTAIFGEHKKTSHKRKQAE
jgi:hypothetical protein